MKQILIRNIGMLAGIQPESTCCLCGSEMAQMTVLHNAWLIVEDGLIKDFAEL